MIRILTLMFFILFTSCGSDEDSVSNSNGSSSLTSCASFDSRFRLEVIIGELDWYDYRDLQNAREIRNSRTTGQIKIPAINASCTAFLINENTIMTNNHCVPSQNYATGVRLSLRDDNDSKEVFYCESLVATNASLDFSLLECNGYPGDKYGYIPLSLRTLSRNQNIYLVQENCDYLSQPRCKVNKYVSKGQIQRVGVNSISHNADTLGGSSGSPIFHQETHELVGIHHAGLTRTGSEPSVNFGIPIHRIAKYLFDEHPEINIYRSNGGNLSSDGSIIDHCTQ